MKENSRDFCLVIDSGYSFTHIAPFYRGKIILEGIRRLFKPIDMFKLIFIIQLNYIKYT